MDWVVKLTICIVVLIVPAWLYQEQNQEWDILRTMLKDSCNNAVHDAVQEVDDIEKSNGFIVFNAAAAKATFDDTLQRNLGLDSSFNPSSGSRLNKPVRVIYFELLDDSNATFPMLYVNNTYGITRLLNGPAVVAVVETDHPVFIQRAFVQPPIRVPAIYEYKENR